MNIGDRVRVAQSVVVYNHPQHKKQPFDIKGLEGEVVGFANRWQDKPISANFPILVRLAPKFQVHLREEELEAATPS